jgi:hypothetical protein
MLPGRKPQDLAERFWPKVNTAAGQGPAGQCWEWQAGINGHGYGGISLDGKMIGAHRASYLLHNGFIDPSLQVLHSCDNPKCVNPAHLSQGTNLDNVKDMLAKGRQVYQGGVPYGGSAKTHCIHGHELTADNVYTYGSKRQCKTCAAKRAHKRTKLFNNS